jgi:hypothetical protein
MFGTMIALSFLELLRINLELIAGAARTVA